MSLRARLPRTPLTRSLWAAASVARRRLDPRASRERRAVHRGLRLPPLPASRRQVGSVWAVMMVKNEIDLVEATLRHLVRQGVDEVLVVDNGSTDGTAERLAELADRLPLHVGHDGEPRYLQALKMNALATAARRAGADWVVPVDADEFWFAHERRVADVLRSAQVDVVTAELHNVFPAPLGWRLDTAPHWSPKVAFRAHRWAWLEMGNHTVTHPGRCGAALVVAHYPWRSREQLAAKGRQGAAGLTRRQQAQGDGRHWSRLDAADEAWLDEAWSDLCSGRAREDLWWSPVGPFLDVDPRTWATWPADLGHGGVP